MIYPNRKALKNVADFAVDSQFIQGSGTNFFRYQGEENDDYKASRAEFADLVSEAMDHLKALQKYLLPAE